jgi:serine/threonine protein kinase
MSIVLQLISVFSYLHCHGIVHRDIKSHNVLIESGNVKICDFGLARGIVDNMELTEYVVTRW